MFAPSFVVILLALVVKVINAATCDDSFSSSSCAFGTHHLKDNPSTITCPGGGCDANTCCEANPTCGNTDGGNSDFDGE